MTMQGKGKFSKVCTETRFQPSILSQSFVTGGLK